MTKLTKNEKLLREATSKWNKFLKEGAFAQEETLKEFDEDDAYHFDQDKSEGGTMGEYGKMDAEQGLPPTKIGRGNEKYMAAYNAVLQARGEEPLDIQKPDQAYLDALRSGQLEEQEKEADPRVVAMQRAMDLLDDLQFDSLESALDNMNTEVVRKLGIMLKQLDYNRNQVGNIQENEKKTFKVGDFVRIVSGGLKGATGKVIELTTLITNEPGLVVLLDSPADKRVFGQAGDEVVVGLEHVEPPIGQMRENEKNFKVGDEVRIIAGGAAGGEGKVVNTSKGEFGTLAFIVKLEKDADDSSNGRAGEEVAVQPEHLDDRFYRGDFGMELYDIDEKKNLKEEVAKRVNELLAEGLTPEQIQEKIIEEGIGDFIRKGVDFAKKKTGLGKSAASLKGLRALKIHKDDYFRLKEKFLPTERDIKNYLDFIKNNARRKGGGIDRDAFDSALGRIRDEALDTLRNPTNFLRAVSKVENKMDDTYDELRSAGRGDKTFQKVRDSYRAILKDMESRRDFVKGLSAAFKQAARDGDVQAVEDIYNQEVADAKALRARTAMLDKMAKEDEAEKRAKKGVTTKKNPDDSMEFTGGQMSSKSRFAEKLSPEDRAHYDSVMNKGKVPNLKGDMGPIPGLEGPFQYRSGAVLYYDPKAGKYYDRGKDMYLDNDEAARLIMEKDEKEFAKIFARAKDMLVLSARSRVPVSLKSVQSSLDVIKIPSEMEKGKLIVKNEYVIADKNELPESAKQISFTKYAMDYLSNLPGEQLDLPME